MKKILVAVVMLVAICGCGDTSAEDWKKDDFIKLWNNVRKTITNEDYTAFMELTIPAKPPKKQIKKEHFAKAKTFLLDTYPDLSSINFLKFDQNKKEAIFVLQTYLDDKNYITIDAYKFIRTDKVWKLSGQVGGASFPKTGTGDDKKRIEKELKENKKFQLNSEQKNPPDKK